MPLYRRKRKEARETLGMNPMLGRQRGIIFVWWPMESSKFSGLWKVLNLVTLGMFHVWLPLEREGKTFLSPPSTFHPKDFT